MIIIPLNNWFVNLTKRQISNSSVRWDQNLSVCFKWAELLRDLQELLDAGPSSDWFINVLRVCRKLQFQPLSAEVPVLFRVVELPQKQHLCKVKSLNKGDANSEVTVYYQVGKQPNYKVHNSTYKSFKEIKIIPLGKIFMNTTQKCSALALNDPLVTFLQCGVCTFTSVQDLWIECFPL